MPARDAPGTPSRAQAARRPPPASRSEALVAAPELSLNVPLSADPRPRRPCASEPDDLQAIKAARRASRSTAPCSRARRAATVCLVLERCAGLAVDRTVRFTSRSTSAPARSCAPQRNVLGAGFDVELHVDEAAHARRPSQRWYSGAGGDRSGARSRAGARRPSTTPGLAPGPCSAPSLGPASFGDDLVCNLSITGRRRLRPPRCAPSPPRARRAPSVRRSPSAGRHRRRRCRRSPPGGAERGPLLRPRRGSGDGHGRHQRQVRRRAAARRQAWSLTARSRQRALTDAREDASSSPGDPVRAPRQHRPRPPAACPSRSRPSRATPPTSSSTSRSRTRSTTAPARAPSAAQPGVAALTEWLAAQHARRLLGLLPLREVGQGLRLTARREPRHRLAPRRRRQGRPQAPPTSSSASCSRPTRAGNPQALARRMGVQELIWDCGYWGAGMTQLPALRRVLHQAGQVAQEASTRRSRTATTSTSG